MVTQMVVDIWNMLPEELVEAGNITIFNRLLESFTGMRTRCRKMEPEICM